MAPRITTQTKRLIKPIQRNAQARAPPQLLQREPSNQISKAKMALKQSKGLLQQEEPTNLAKPRRALKQSKGLLRKQPKTKLATTIPSVHNTGIPEGATRTNKTTSGGAHGQRCQRELPEATPSIQKLNKRKENNRQQGQAIPWTSHTDKSLR